MKKLLTIATAVFLTTSPAQAYNWVEVGSSFRIENFDDKMYAKHELSMSSITEVNGARYGTMRMLFSGDPEKRWINLERTTYTVKALCKDAVITIEGSPVFHGNARKLMSDGNWILDVTLRRLKELGIPYSEDQELMTILHLQRKGFLRSFKSNAMALLHTKAIMSDLDAYICGIDRNTGTKGLPEA